ncbi:hypothetical protein [Streptomyces cellulosae]|uniref:hypothetical protein n=1 Tax=Streptomyces cellulosae TaxID=1968 RepID=UPI002D21AFC1|nr:hypothetical protein [Streptomyces cellulosae]
MCRSSPAWDRDLDPAWDRDLDPAWDRDLDPARDPARDRDRDADPEPEPDPALRLPRAARSSMPPPGNGSGPPTLDRKGRRIYGSYRPHWRPGRRPR